MFGWLWRFAPPVEDAHPFLIPLHWGSAIRIHGSIETVQTGRAKNGIGSDEFKIRITQFCK